MSNVTHTRTYIKYVCMYVWIRVCMADLRYASISRSLLPYNRSLLTLPHTSGMPATRRGLEAAKQKTLFVFHARAFA